MTEVFLVRQDKCPRHADAQGVFVFTDLETARLWTKTVDIADHTRTRDMVLKRDGPDTDVSCFQHFIDRAGVFDDDEGEEGGRVIRSWTCGDGWLITQQSLNPGMDL